MTFAGVKLKRVLVRSDAGAWGEEPTSGHGTPVLRATEIGLDGVIDPRNAAVRSLSPRELAATRLQDDDLVVVKSSGSDAHLGKTGRVTCEVEAKGVGFSNFLQRLRVDSSCDSRFVWYFLNSSLVKRQIRLLSSTSTGLQNLSASLIGELDLPRPSLDEQRRIADFLDAETRLLDRAAASKSSLQGILRERLNAVRSLGLDALSETHGEVPLRRMIRGIEQGSSPLCDSEPAGAGEWGVLKLSSVKRGQFNPHENKRLADGAALARYEVREGDLLVTRANTPDLVGDVAVARGDVVKKLLPDLVYRLRLSEGVQADFVAEVLLGRRVRGLIEATARGSSQSMVKLRGEDIRSWPIPNAGASVQSEFVRRMRVESERVWALAEAIGRQQQLIVERRQAVITAAVTGQTDVTTARGAGV